MDAPPVVALVLQDEVLRRRLEALAREIGARVIVAGAPAALAPDAPPTALVVELELAGAVDAIAAWKRQWPRCLIAGSLGVPRQDLWNAGLAAGCTVVANRGAVDRQLRARLARPDAGVRRLRVTLAPRAGDGPVGALPDAPDGPIVMFRAGGTLYAIDDTCPHARAALADGRLEGAVLTCRQHGSQFDVRTGARLRGPADFPVRTYRVVEADGELWVEVP